jgi:hypothetical protein
MFISARSVAVLFARRDSVYYGLPGCDVFDEDRRAESFDLGAPVVAHPPCRGFGRFAWRANASAYELSLGYWAVSVVRYCGGVLEHPAHSRLFRAVGAARPGRRDSFGGWIFPVNQGDFGHQSPKPTWLYIVGVEPSALPSFPLALGLAPGRIELMGRAAREATPEPFARWLVDLASRSSQAARRAA